MKVSHTQVSTYLQCGEKWRLQYEEKLRGPTLGSPLFFGRAIDAAIGRVLLDKKKQLTDTEIMIKDMDDIELFDSHMQSTVFNYETIQLDKHHAPRYSASDVDLQLLLPVDYNNISKFASECGILVAPSEIGSLLDDMNHRRKVDKKILDQTDQCVYNYICWNALRRKGHLLIEAFKQQVYPLIGEVLTLQEAVSLKDGSDELIGFIDMIATFTDDPTTPYVIDLKTASKAYKEDSVRTSDQLALYCEYKQMDKAAFIVIEKTLRKKAPQVRIQIIKDTIPQRQIDDTFDKISKTIENIENRIFDKNKESCYAFGKQCDYYGLCHFGSHKNLVSFKGVENGSKQSEGSEGGKLEAQAETSGTNGSREASGGAGQDISGGTTV
jgi:CRISPR/Cas system-associated exonuclease Cas4 (RecB family)